MTKNEIDNILRGVKDIFEQTASFSKRNKHAITYLADYYRHLIDNNAELFYAEFPQYRGSYSCVNNHIGIIDICEEKGTPYYIMRDIIRLFRDLCYFYGYRSENNKRYEKVDLSGYNNDETKELLIYCNKLIDDKEYTTQQIYTILKITHQGYNHISNTHTKFSDVDEFIDYIELVSNELSQMYDNIQPENDLSWNKFGGSLDYLYNDLHHKGLEESAKNKIIRQIKNGEIDIEEY